MQYFSQSALSINKHPVTKGLAMQEKPFNVQPISIIAI